MKPQTSTEKTQAISGSNHPRICTTDPTLAIARNLAGASASHYRIKTWVLMTPPAQEGMPGTSQTVMQIRTAGDSKSDAATLKSRAETTEELARIDKLQDIDEKLEKIDALFIKLGIPLPGNQPQSDKVIAIDTTAVAPAPAPSTSAVNASPNTRSKKRTLFSNGLPPYKRSAPINNKQKSVTTPKSVQPPKTALEIFNTDYPQTGLILPPIHPGKR